MQSFASTSLSNSNSKLAWYAVLIAFGVALLSLSAKIQVPSYPVPMTLQTLAVIGLAGAYGFRLGLATIIAYLGAGLAGAPVFAKLTEFGPAYFLGSTGGYLAGFVVATAIIGWAADRGWGKNMFKIGGAMIVGEIAIFALGFAWLASLIGAEKAFAFGVVPYVVGDLIKVALAAIIVSGIWKTVKR